MASLHTARDRGDFDLEAWEEAIRNAVLCYGASLLEGLLTKTGCGRRDAPCLMRTASPCTGWVRSRPMRSHSAGSIITGLRRASVLAALAFFALTA